MKKSVRKTVVWLLSLITIVVLNLLLSSCGAIRISSINTRDDNALKNEAQLDNLYVESRSTAVEDQKANLQIKKNAFGLKAKGIPNKPTEGWFQGLVINTWQERKVIFVLKLGSKEFIRYTVNPTHGRVEETQLVVYLPQGKYKVEQWEKTLKGTDKTGDWDVEVSDTPADDGSYRGSYFVISN
jgi:hypothetical protein